MRLLIWNSNNKKTLKQLRMRRSMIIKSNSIFMLQSSKQTVLSKSLAKVNVKKRNLSLKSKKNQLFNCKVSLMNLKPNSTKKEDKKLSCLSNTRTNKYQTLFIKVAIQAKYLLLKIINLIRLKISINNS